MRILIADDQAHMRSALRRVLKEEFGLTNVVEATNLGELFLYAYQLQPDLVLLDWELSGLPSAALSLPPNDPKRRRSEQLHNVVLLDLHKLESHPYVIVLSTYPEAKAASMAGGADAFVYKGIAPNQLAIAIRDLLHIPE
ncbi:response regulator [bacterium]|nr:response regulator [bacterium]